MTARAARRVIFSADDFGLSESVNEAVERAHRDGLLSTASLMVSAPAAADAVARARRLPGLRVGLHLVVIEGRAALPPARIPHLVGPDGWFPSDQWRLGLRYFFSPVVRRELAREIEAQFEGFAATGLRLDHANAHKHMHLHPTVGRMLIEAGLRHGLRAIRVPAEPQRPLRAADGTRTGPGGRALLLWTRLLRAQARRARLATTECCFGLAWSGQMREARVARLVAHLPPGLSEIYFHPAARPDPLLARLMPGYAQEAELATLLGGDLVRALEAHGVVTAGWPDA